MHLKIRRSGIALGALLIGAFPAVASNFSVTTNADSGPGSLRQAISDSNAAGGTNTITFNPGLGTIALAADLPAIQAGATLLGGNNTLDGNGKYRGFLIGSWTAGTSTLVPVAVAIQDLTIQHAKAQGGSGSGGGAGLGGAVLVAADADLTLSDVTLTANNATGGAGGNPTAGGGGGMGGNGGASGGGGLGIGANGGDGTGAAGGPGIAVGAAPGGSASGGGAGGFNGGGGGGSANGMGGGGGGVGGKSAGTNAGNGGQGGGGGAGGPNGNAGGKGGFGGGGGAGGYGGGSGGGGFGGGNGVPSALAIEIYYNNPAGFGAGVGLGGGGGGMGGALFVQQGASVTFAGPVAITQNTVAGGSPSGYGSPGSAFGAGIFIQGNNAISFAPAAGQTETVSDEIGDQTGNGATGGQAGAGGVTLAGPGTLILSGQNTYAGATSVNGGTLLVNGSLAAPGAVAVAAGATLGGGGTIGGAVTEMPGGLLAPGNGAGALTVGGSFTWNGSTDGSAGMQCVLGNGSSASSQLALGGTLTKGSAGTFAFNFRGTGYAAGTYTLATFASTTFSASDFSYANLGWGLAGTFAIVGGTQLQFSVAPAPVTIQSGQSVAFNAPSNGAPATSVQWAFDHSPISGATDRVLVVSSANSASGGTYDCTVISPAGTTVFSFSLAVVSAANPGYLSNMSGRGFAGAGADGLFGGFQVSGSAPKQLLIRGVGPGLGSAFGLSGFLPDPVLILYNAAPAQIGENQVWGGTELLVAAQSAVGAFSLPTHSLDSMLDDSQSPGSYSMTVSGASGDTGLAMVEIYDADAAPPVATLNNISVRGPVSAGQNILIGGFVVAGTTDETVLIRGVGPGLTDTFHLSGTLSAPALTLYSGAAPIYSNTGWAGDSAIAAAISQTGAFSLNPAHRDSALLVTLPPGAYTAQVAGADGGTGIALVEIYQLP